MFELLFTYPAIQTRHRSAPCAEAREQFLRHCADQGYCQSMLKKIAWILLVISQDGDLCRSKTVTQAQIECAVDHRARLQQQQHGIDHAASSRQMFIHFVEAWLRFQGSLVESQPVPEPFSAYVDEFVRFMKEERGLSPVTIATYRQQVTNFLSAIWYPGSTLSAISIKDVDAYLTLQGNQGWSRSSLHTLASTLRSFFRYAEGKKWCYAIATAIEAPRVFAEEGLPLGPTWEVVQQLIDRTAEERPADIRNRAILLLLAVYGLRRGEVARLRLEDVDWEGEILHVVRPKQRCTQHYPLVTSVGNAIVRYLKEVRPRCAYRALFMTLHAPTRPLLPASITPIVHARLTAMGVRLPRNGAHCLRHACARHLLANGFSLKQIGDQLGHRSTSATRHYAKVDLDGLRQVAELDLEGVL